MIDITRTLMPLRTRRVLLGAATIGVLAAAGCSSSGGGSQSTGGAASGSQPAGSSAAAGAATGQTVAIRNVPKTGDVLTDAKGRTLYFSDQEASGKVLCSTSDCTAIWMPLIVTSGQMPTGPDTVSGKLSAVKRPDGKMQAALNGAPLYTFQFDHSAGDVGGNNQKDSFGGTNFTWHVATPAGTASAPATQAPTSGSNGGGGGGGGYGYGY